MFGRKKRRRRKKNPLDYIAIPKLDLDPETKKGIFIVLVLAVGAIGVLSLFNLAGNLGVYFIQGMEYGLGWGKWLFPFILLAIGFFLYNEDKYEIRGLHYFALFIFIICFHGLVHLFIEQEKWQEVLGTASGGGYLGYFIASSFFKLMGFWASLIILISLLLISFMLMFNRGLRSLIGGDSWLAKLFYPFSFVYAKIFKREKKDEDEDEEEEEDEEDEGDEGEDEEGEEDEESEEDEDEEDREEEEREFRSHKIKEAEEEFLWKPTGIKINLPLSLLNGKIGKPTSGDVKNNVLIIQRTLENFGIPVEMGEVCIGPTVTQYTLKPAEGIKLSRITALNNDLSLALAAHPIRMEAPIPGKRLVGIEVPNQAKAIVSLKEALSTGDYKKRKTNLTIALGKDVAGKAWLDDLGRMPHLLVAGATGSGKSVMLNSIIISLLYQNNPDDVRFIMVDPKRVELPVYNGIPYLLTPVITEVGKTINALKWCLNEMDRRFDVLSKSGRRDISSYNKSSKYKMPYIIFIIDELADLMVAAARDIEAGIIRLAQMARAVGIHLVLATQRPSVDVITGLIKANMPARIAFSVASSVDSRTILDSQGAEKLLGRGDMLFITSEMSKPKRLQGAFVSDQEIKKIVRYIQEKGGQPDYKESIIEKQKVHGVAGVGLDGEDDELFEEAEEVVINAGKASASLLQRRLRVGYARAARLIDMLEDAGIVGPADGARPREVLLSREQYDRMADQGVSGVSLHKQEEADEPEEYLDDDEEDEDEEESFDDAPRDKARGKQDRDDEDEEDDDEDEEDEDDQDEEEEEEEEKEVEESSYAEASEDKDDEDEEEKDKDEEGKISTDDIYEEDEEEEGKFFSR